MMTFSNLMLIQDCHSPCGHFMNHSRVTIDGCYIY